MNHRSTALSGLDKGFLLFETPETPMHVAALLRFSVEQLQTEEGGLDIQRIRDLVETRLDDMPRYRQHIIHRPLSAEPAWMDSEGFDLTYHVRHTALPQPGDRTALNELAGRLIEQPLDRKRPLWELWVIEGLAEDEFALLFKIHHCMVDGASGMQLLFALLSLSADEQVEFGSDWSARPRRSGLTLWAEELEERISRSVELASLVGEVVRHPRRALRRAGASIHDIGQAVGGALMPHTGSPLNARLGRHRRIERVSFELSSIKEISKATQSTVNDVLLAVVAGGLRGFFEKNSGLDRELALRVCLPVDCRPPDDDFKRANCVSVLFADLPVDEPDPLACLLSIRNQTETLKKSGAAHGTELLVEMNDLLGADWLTRLGKRFASRLSPFNLIVTNIRGPSVPLYLQGVRLRSIVPFVPLVQNQGLGVAIASYCDRIDLGLSADREQIPNLGDLARSMLDAQLELQDAVWPPQLEVTPARA